MIVMSKIIKCTEEVVVIGMDDKSIREFRVEDCNFEPKVGDVVDVFESETYCVVSKVEEKVKEEQIDMKKLAEGININISNDNSQKNTGAAYTQGAYVQAGKVVNKVTYLLLCFFLGGLGIHKFYSGKIGAGILYALFCWTSIPSIIAFIEFIVGCFKKADVHGNIVV